MDATVPGLRCSRQNVFRGELGYLVSVQRQPGTRYWHIHTIQRPTICIMMHVALLF